MKTITKRICIAQRLCDKLDRCYCHERSSLGYTRIQAIAFRDEVLRDMVEAEQYDALDEYFQMEEQVTKVDILLGDIEKELDKIGRYGDEKRRYTRRKPRTIVR